MSRRTDAIEAGARNLLQNCAEARPGDRVLIVGERCAAPFFEPALCAQLARVARELGLDARVIMAAPVVAAAEFPRPVAAAMADADQTIFCSRLGDQVRFLESPGAGRKIMCYTLTLDHLGSPFATIDYRAMKRMHDLLAREIQGARRYRIDTADGTRRRAALGRPSAAAPAPMTGFTVDLFPVMIFPPVNFHAAAGRLVLKDFLMSTSTRAYADSVLRLPVPVTARVEDCRIVDLDGDAAVTGRIRAQLERAARISGGDPLRLNSWHTGINPHTWFDGDPDTDLERWGTVAYGSPRYTHIHAAGRDPGDASIHLFDATIEFDDRLFWNRGRFVFLDRPDVRALFDDIEYAPDSSTRMPVGIPARPRPGRPQR